MWYTTRHENTHFYPTNDRGRTAPNPGGTAFLRCLCDASLPDLAQVTLRSYSTNYDDNPSNFEILHTMMVIVRDIWQKLSNVERDVTLIVTDLWQLFSYIFGETLLIVRNNWRNHTCVIELPIWKHT
jgi:hypothetical protein